MTPTTPEPARLAVALSTSDVSVVFDVSDGALPAVVHWGERLQLEPEDLDALITTGVGLNGPNDIDEPRRVAVLPEQHRAWLGRPGLQGSRDGRAWSTRFVVDSILLNGEPVTGHHVGGPGLLEVHAADAGAGLELRLDLALDPSGLLRARASVTNVGHDPFTVDGVALAMPLPAGHDELLDFAGRWGRERTPQRSTLHTGIHLRENRRGRTGADSAYVLHAGAPGFGFRRGELRAVHTGWSGNHVHYAEKVFTGETVLGGGELLLPGEVRLAQGESYTTPWVFFSTGNGLDAVARRFHQHLRSRPRRVTTDRPVTLNVWEAVYFDHRLDRLRRAGRAGRPGGRRALRARRRVVRRPARRHRRPGRLGRLPGRLAERAAPARRPGA